MVVRANDDTSNCLFTCVPACTYCVEFSSIPASWSITLQNQVPDAHIDCDADPVTAQSQNIVLVADDCREDMGGTSRKMSSYRSWARWRCSAAV